jgi:hypothetical protein
MGTFLNVDDLAPFATIDAAKAEAMIEDAEAMAVLAAPCITAGDFSYVAAVRAILRGAVLRWNDSGSGALQAQTAGPFGQTLDTRQQRRGMFWPSEIEQLQGLCRTETSGAFAIDTAPGSGSAHVPWCSLLLGATYCSCGADIAGVPIYEVG